MKTLFFLFESITMNVTTVINFDINEKMKEYYYNNKKWKKNIMKK